jgi:type VI secretion system protein ImpM
MPGPALNAPALGFFGKLPSRGDFVRGGLSRDFVTGWDAWLQRSLADVLPKARDRWLAGPSWQFQVSAGLCGAQAASGIILPSVDGIGRYFPLTVASIGASIPPSLLTEAAAVARTAISRNWPPDKLVACLRSLSAQEDTGLAVMTPGLTVSAIGHNRPDQYRMPDLSDHALFASVIGGDVDGENSN